MGTRRRLGRRRHRTRRQRGGGVLDKFKFRYFIEDNLLGEDETALIGSNKGTIILLSGDAAKEIIHCQLDYEIQGEGANKIAYLENIECTTKSDFFQPLSYLIIKKLMDILENSGIEYVYLRVASNVFGVKRPFFHKLFHFYRTMGFICLPPNISPESNANPVSTHYFVQKTLPNFLNTANRSNKNTSEANVTALIGKYRSSCGKMLGKVLEIKEILEREIVEKASIFNMLGDEE